MPLSIPLREEMTRGNDVNYKYMVVRKRPEYLNRYVEDKREYF